MSFSISAAALVAMENMRKKAREMDRERLENVAFRFVKRPGGRNFGLYRETLSLIPLEDNDNGNI